MREGSYQLPDGRKVDFTGEDTISLATDLYQLVEQQYHGSDSVQAKRLETILRHLHGGMPLDTDEWNILHDLQDRYGAKLERWRRAGKDGQGAEMPEGEGRITESAGVMATETLAKLREQEPYKTPSTTPKDRAASIAHLTDSVLHDLAHTTQHIKRLFEPDVKASKQSQAFNAEHALNHAESAHDHAKKLDEHLKANPSEPDVHRSEREILNSFREAEHLIDWLPDTVTVLMRESRPSPPPGLRKATQAELSQSPMHACDSCDMFWQGHCSGYNGYPVQWWWVCNSYELDQDKASTVGGEL